MSAVTAGFTPESFLADLQAVLPTGRSFIGLHEPTFAGNEWTYVRECLDTGWVSSVGKFVTRFEEMLVAYTGVPYAVATVNGTAALHICLILAGVQAQDEVLIPDLTFIATANAVSYLGAVPHLVDCEWTSLGLDPRALDAYLTDIAERRADGTFNARTGRRLRAVVPMHTFGHPVDLDTLREVADRWGLVLIEDAAESLGSFYGGKHTGAWGQTAALSFNGNKTVTTGGGGAILTTNAELARRAKHLTTTAKQPHAWAFYHDETGYNYRLPNLNAALGCAQLEQLEGFLAKKRELAARWQARFPAHHPHVRFVAEPPGTTSNYWLNAVLLEPGVQHLRDDLLNLTNAQGIMTRPAWTLMHRLPMFAACPKAPTPVAEAIEARLLNLPSSPFLVDEPHRA
jgi:perosamine synthetase